MDKVVRDGKVAVLYSPGYGSGWSTWNDDEKEFLLFDPEIVAAVEKKDYKLAAQIAVRRGEELFGPGEHTCVLAADNLVIGWVPEGEAFEITEYDGYEDIRILSEHSFRRA